MGQYAPYETCNCGAMQWMPDTDSAFLMQSQTAGWGPVLVADTNDEIQNVWATLCASFNPPNALALEVFDITDGLPVMSDLVATTYYPGADLANANIGAKGRGSFSGFVLTDTDIYQAINSPTQTKGTYKPTDTLPAWPVDDDSFICGQNGNGYTYFYKIAGVAGQHVGQWITRLRHTWYVQRFSNGDDKASVSVQSMIRINGTAYPGDSVTFSDEIAGGHVIVTDWYNNPATGLPWTPNVVDKFDESYSGLDGDYGFGWQASGTGVASVTPLIFQSWVDVEAAPDDQRLAIGALRANTKLQGWRLVQLLDPNDSTETTMTLVANHKYLWQWRLVRYQQGTGNGMAMCRLDQPGVDLPGPPFWTSMNVPLDRQTHRLNGLGEEQSTVAGILLQKVGNAYSLDSQFYAETAPTGLDTPNAWPDISAFFEISPVDINHSFHQKFTPTTTADYGWFRIKTCMATGTVQDDLNILIFRVSDGVHMAPIIRITADDLTSPNTEWQTVEFRVDDVPLVAGVQYAYAVYSATSHRQGWLVQIADGGLPTGAPGGPPLSSWDVAWGGLSTPVDTLTIFNTQVANPDPGTVWPATAELNFSTIPDGPGYFDAFAGDDTCLIQPVTIMWSSPDLPTECGGFLSTQVERSDDGGTTWFPICNITDMAVGEFEDVEWDPTVSPVYRARTFRGDGVPSDYTEEITVEIRFPDNICGLWFTSNEQPDLSVFYPDIGEGSIPPREFAFPVERQVFTPLNRDLSIVYTGLEDRGSQFSAVLKVRSGIVNTPGVPCVADACADYALEGVDVFDPLLAIARADLSYVTCRNEHGNRWFANLNVTTSKWNLPGEIFTATVGILPVSNVPSQPDAVAVS